MSKVAVNLKNVTKLYSNKRGISGVSLKVKSDEIFGFLGPNGSGKTTTIRCIMDFIRPNSGSITVFGNDAHSGSVDVKAQIGFLSADPQLYPRWNGKQYLEFLSKFRGKNDVSGIIERLGLDTSIQFQHLSTGNKQKLALVVALYGKPKLLVMDEPTKGLDPLLQQEMYAILHEFKQSGGTVFFSSHNLPEVEKICDRIGVIKDGKIIANETLQTIRSMAIHIITIVTTTPIKRIDFALPGVEITHSSDKHMLLKVKGDLDPLMRAIGKYKLKDLEISHASLEDIFLEYYR